jgi:hypothetical protein
MGHSHSVKWVRRRLQRGIEGEHGGTWAGYSPSASVSPANHSTNFSIIIITRGWDSRPLSGRSVEWTLIPPPNMQIKKTIKNKRGIDRTSRYSVAVSVLTLWPIPWPDSVKRSWLLPVEQCFPFIIHCLCTVILYEKNTKSYIFDAVDEVKRDRSVLVWSFMSDWWVKWNFSCHLLIVKSNYMFSLL